MKKAGCTGTQFGWTGLLLWSILLGAAAFPAAARAQYVLDDAHDKDRYSPASVILPFAFYTSSYRFGAGAVWNASGLIQPQSDTFALAFASINGSYGLLAGLDSLQIKPVERLFADMNFAFFRESKYTTYLDGNRAFPHSAAGGNDSSPRNFYYARNDDAWGSATLRYLLPIGGGHDVIVNRYVLENGMLKEGATGGDGYNPLSTGRTFIQVTPFYEYMTLSANGVDRHVDTNGLRAGVFYDNTDFPLNPSTGNSTRILVSRDFGLLSSSNPWTNVEGEITQYFDVGVSKLFRQQVIALQGWTSYSPTWGESNDRPSGASSDPPFYEGATLGGPNRLRGFDEGRFHDRAAIYGSAELRLVPRWNPFAGIELLKKADLTWMQCVVFAEAGRVAPDYSPHLLSHLKGDAGFGVRLLANDTLVRFDVAASAEGFSVWVGLGQPF